MCGGQIQNIYWSEEKLEWDFKKGEMAKSCVSIYQENEHWAFKGKKNYFVMFTDKRNVKLVGIFICQIRILENCGEGWCGN